MYPINPANEFYMNQANQSQMWLPFPPQQQTPRINSRFVTNVDEAKAAMIDGISYNVFLDSSTGKIYLKKLGNNGVSDFLVYTIEEPEVKADPITEINSRLTKIENFIGGLNDKSISSNAGIRQPEPVPYTTVAEQNERHDETESAGISKNAGNGWRKK